MSEYTPTTGLIRARYCDSIALAEREPERSHSLSLSPEEHSENHAEFDRWLAAHDAQVRADERKRIAAAIRESIPYGYGMNPDGTEDSCAMAYVEGVHDAYRIARAGGAS